MVILTTIERETLQVFFFFYIFYRCSMCPPLLIRQTFMRQSISFHTRVSISRSTRATVAVIQLRRSWRLAGSGGTKTVSFTNPQKKKSRKVLNPGTRVPTALTRHLLFLCVLSIFVASFDWDTGEYRCSLLEFCSKSSLHSHSGRGSCVCQNTKWLLTFTERHICYYCLLAANQGNYVRRFFLTKKKLGAFLSLSA